MVIIKSSLATSRACPGWGTTGQIQKVLWGEWAALIRTDLLIFFKTKGSKSKIPKFGKPVV